MYDEYAGVEHLRPTGRDRSDYERTLVDQPNDPYHDEPDSLSNGNGSGETVSWSCSDCGETLTAPTYLDLRQCGECGEWQDVPDGSGLRMVE